MNRFSRRQINENHFRQDTLLRTGLIIRFSIVYDFIECLELDLSQLDSHMSQWIYIVYYTNVGQ